MNRLLELEPRETDADELDVDTAFSAIADAAITGAAPDDGRRRHCCTDGVSDRFFATGFPE